MPGNVEGNSENNHNNTSTSNGGDIGEIGIEHQCRKEADGSTQQESPESPSNTASNEIHPVLRKINNLGRMNRQPKSRAPTRELPNIIQDLITLHEEGCAYNEGMNGLNEAGSNKATAEQYNRRERDQQRRKGSSPSRWSRNYRPRSP